MTVALQDTYRARYPSHRSQVRVVRRQVERVAGSWELNTNVVADLSLVASELVTNAVVHARTSPGRQIGVTLRLSAETVRIEVRDADPSHSLAGPPEPGRAPAEPDEGGRGLLLVESLSLKWGVTREVVGKTVWADVARAGSAC